MKNTRATLITNVVLVALELTLSVVTMEVPTPPHFLVKVGRLAGIFRANRW